MSYKNIICGIYKITSPSNKIYIGESSNIKNRWNGYYSLNNCKGQRKLFNSFKKHGVQNHLFEIIEECLFEDLRRRERYWQDFYDVLSNKGMNLRLTECDELKRVVSEETKEKIRNINKGRKHSKEARDKMSKSRSNGKNARAQLVLDLQTGIFYDCAKDAAEAYNLNWNSLRHMLNGNNKNNTALIYVKNYYEGLEIPIIIEPKNKVKSVIDVSTKIVYESPKEVSKLFNINLNTLKGMLNGNSQNYSTFMYLKDYMISGELPKIKERVTTGKQVIDTSTNIIYKSVKEVSIKFNLNYDNLKGKLNGSIKNNTTFKYL